MPSSDLEAPGAAAGQVHGEPSSELSESRERVAEAEGELAARRQEAADADEAVQEKERELEAAREELETLEGDEKAAAEQLQGVFVDADVDIDSQKDELDAAAVRYDQAWDAFLGENGDGGAYASFWTAPEVDQAVMRLALDDEQNPTSLYVPVIRLLESVSQLAGYTAGDGCYYGGAIIEADDAKLESDKAHAEQDRIEGEIEQSEAEKAAAEDRVSELTDRIARLEGRRGALEGDDGEIAEAKRLLDADTAALDEAEGRLGVAREAYDEAQAALDAATPATLAGHAMRADQALQAVAKAQMGREEALRETLDREDEVKGLEVELEAVTRDLGEDSLIEDLRRAKENVERLEQSLERLRSEAEGAVLKVTEADERLKRAETTLDEVRKKYEDARGALVDPDTGEPLDGDAATVLDASARLIEAAEEISSAYVGRCEAREALYQYARFSEAFDHYDAGVPVFVPNTGGLNDNLKAGADAYKALLDEWEAAKGRLETKRAEVGALGDEAASVRQARDAAVRAEREADGEARAARDALEIAVGRDRIATACRNVEAAWARALEAALPLESRPAGEWARASDDDRPDDSGDDVSDDAVEAIGALARVAAEVATISSNPVLERVVEGVYEVVSMPAVDTGALAAAEVGRTSDDVLEVWWCVYVDGVRVRVMDAHERLAPGIALLVWSEDADTARAALAGSGLGSGTVVVITPEAELFLEVVWA